MTREEADILINSLFDRKLTVDEFWGELGISFDDEVSFYLINVTKPSNSAHIWLGNDTACRMHSTGGLGSIFSKNGKKKFEVVKNIGNRDICYNCKRLLEME